MKDKKAFTEEILLSTLFREDGTESASAVIKRWKNPFPMVNFYQHVNRHMKPKIGHWNRVMRIGEKAPVKELVEQTMEVVDAPTLSTSAHEQTLDEFIAKGRQKLNFDTLPINGTTLIAAIKAKAEIENKTKDRRYDALKSLFTGAAPKELEDGPEKVL